MRSNSELQPDSLTQKIGVLTRREVEVRILAPVIQALGDHFDKDEVISVVKKTIIELAKKQGAELAEALGGTGTTAFMESLSYWTQDDALLLDVIQENETELHFNVTRCRYAELYTALGIPELGAVLSCNRDFALIEGFNPEASLKRTQTIMQGASYCDFRYTFPQKQTKHEGTPQLE